MVSPQWPPDAGIVAPEEIVFGGFEIAIGMQDGAIFHEDGAADRAFALGMGMRGERTGPGDVAVTDRIEHIAAFAESEAVLCALC